MPIDYKEYPKNWKAISLRIRKERAGQCCEECGVANGNCIKFPPKNRAAWQYADGSHLEDAEIEDGLLKVMKIVLTVAHIGAPRPDGSPGNKHDKHDVRDANLKALCQWCHLKLDAKDHAQNRKYGRKHKDQPKLF